MWNERISFLRSTQFFRMASSKPQVIRTYSKRDGFQRRAYQDPPPLLSPILSQQMAEVLDIDTIYAPPLQNPKSSRSKAKKSDNKAKRKGSKAVRRPPDPRRGGYCPLHFVPLAPPKGSQISLSHLSDSASIPDTLHSNPSSLFTADDSW
jgi:hypothetical protein